MLSPASKLSVTAEEFANTITLALLLVVRNLPSPIPPIADSSQITFAFTTLATTLVYCFKDAVSVVFITIKSR